MVRTDHLMSRDFSSDVRGFHPFRFAGQNADLVLSEVSEHPSFPMESVGQISRASSASAISSEVTGCRKTSL